MKKIALMNYRDNPKLFLCLTENPEKYVWCAKKIGNYF